MSSLWNFVSLFGQATRRLSFQGVLSWYRSQARRISDTKEVEFNLEVMTNQRNNNFLFLEAGSDFADVIISFLTLPLGTVVRVLNQHYGDDETEASTIFGSVTTLYNGLENLDSDYFWTEGCKKMLLNPRISFDHECRRLKFNINDTQSTKYFCCEDFNCVYPRQSNISMHYDVAACRCGKSLKREISVRDSSDTAADGGIFTVKKASYVVSSGMHVVPNVDGSVMETLSILGITDKEGTEQWNMTFGMNEIVILLERLLLPHMNCEAAKTETLILFDDNEKEATSNSKKMVLKVMVQKSTNKLLFAQSEEDFVDFLFSFLTIPLGGVAFLLGGKTSLTELDNLYRSVANMNGGKYLRNPDTKSRLLNPKLPQGYMSKNQILPLTEGNAPRLYYNIDLNAGKEWLSYTGHAPAIEFRNDHRGSYVTGPTMYMVRDDLTVTPLCMIPIFSILNEMKIPLSDVKEVEVQIGLQEALRILKASLTSTCALTDGLMIDSMLRKQPKQEH